jgi:hypothetical protein
MSTQQAEAGKANKQEGVDIVLLADEVYRLLLQELRVERERQRFTSKRSFRNMRSS